MGMTQLKMIRPGFWWRPRFLIFSAPTIVAYECKREIRWFGRRWRARDTNGRELFCFDAWDSFRLADGRRRKVNLHRGALGFFLGGSVETPSITGDQCEELSVSLREPHLHWEMTTSKGNVVAAAKLMLYGWRVGYEIDIYAEEYREEILAFAIFYNLHRKRLYPGD